MLVDPEISRAKLGRELDAWRGDADRLRARGVLLLRHEDLEVDVAFGCPFHLRLEQQALGLIVLTVRLEFTDYDLKPPSVRFVNAFSGESEPASIAAMEDKADGSGANPILHPHPVHERQFFCAPGNLEYHTHPQHDGDLWPLYRASGAGRLRTICERIHAATAGIIRGWELVLSVAEPPIGQGFIVQLQAVTDGQLAAAAAQQHAAQAVMAAQQGPR